MAGNTRRNWSTDDLQAAVSAVKNDKISLRRAEGVYGVPKRTIAFYVHGMAWHGKAAIGDKPEGIVVVVVVVVAAVAVISKVVVAVVAKVEVVYL